METKSYYSHEALNVHDLYAFIRSKSFKKIIYEESPEIFDYISSFTCDPEIKNDWLMEGLVEKKYISEVVSYYLKDKYRLPFLSYYPPKEKMDIHKEKQKFVKRDYCMITVQVSLTIKQWNTLKLKYPKEYNNIKERYINDLGW